MNQTFLQRVPHLRAWYHRAFKNRLSALRFVLWIIGIAALGYCLTGYSVSAWHQHQQKAEFAELRSVQNSSLRDVEDRSDIVAEPIPRGGLIGVIEIPRLGVSTVVDEGVDRKTLLVAVGHVPGTAFPGSRGNVALAGHRDTFFRELGQVQTGDDITLTTLRGTYRYNVKSTRIVDPSEREVLASSADGDSVLTLITCYPFHYVGPAPRRFIVVANQTGEPGHAERHAQ